MSSPAPTAGSNSSFSSPLTPIKAIVQSPQMTYKLRMREQVKQNKHLEKQLAEERNLKSDFEWSINELKMKLDEKDARIKILEGQVLKNRQLQDELDMMNALRENHEKLELEFSRTKSKLSSFHDTKRELTQKEEENKSLMSELESVKSQLKRLENLKHTLDKAERQCSILDGEIANVHSELAGKNAMIDQLNTALTQAQNTISQMRELHREEKQSLQKQAIPDVSGEPAGESMGMIVQMKVMELERELQDVKSTWCDPKSHDLLQEKLSQTSAAKKQIETEFVECQGKLLSLDGQYNQIVMNLDSTKQELKTAVERCEKSEEMNSILKEREIHLIQVQKDIDRSRLELKEANTAMQQQLGDLQHTNSILEKKSESLSTALDTEKDTTLQLAIKVENLNGELVKQKMENADLMHQFNEKLEVEERLGLRITSLNREMNESEESHKQEIQSYQEATRNMETRLMQDQVEFEKRMDETLKQWDEQTTQSKEMHNRLLSETERLNAENLRLSEEFQNANDLLSVENDNLNAVIVALETKQKDLISELETVKHSGENELLLIKSQLEETSAREDGLKNEISDMKELILERENQLEENNTMWNENKADFELELQSVKSELMTERETYSITVDELNSEMESVKILSKNELEKLSETIVKLQSSERELLSQIDSMKSDFERETEKHRIRVDELNSNISAVNEELVVAKLNISSAEEEKQALQARIEETCEVLKQSEEKGVELQRSIGVLTSNEETLKAELMDVREKGSNTEQNLKQELDNMQKSLNEETDNKNVMISEFEMKQKVLQSEIDRLTESAESSELNHNSVIGELQTKLTESTAELDKLRCEVEKYDQAMKDMQELSDAKTVELKLSDEKISQLEESLARQIETAETRENNLRADLFDAEDDGLLHELKLAEELESTRKALTMEVMQLNEKLVEEKNHELNLNAKIEELYLALEQKSEDFESLTGEKEKLLKEFADEKEELTLKIEQASEEKLRFEETVKIFQAKVTDYETSLESSERELSESKQNESHLIEELELYKQKSVTAEEQILELQTRNADTDEKLSGMTKELKCAEQDLDIKQQEVIKLKALVGEKDVELIEKDNNILHFTEEVVSLKAVCEEKDQELSEKNAELLRKLNGRDIELAEKENAIESYTNEVKGLKAVLEEKDNELSEKNAELNDKETKIESCLKEVVSLKEVCEEKEQELNEKNAELIERGNMIESFRGEVVSLKASCEERDVELGEGFDKLIIVQETLTVKNEELAAARSENEELTKKLEVFENLESELEAARSEIEVMTAKVIEQEDSQNEKIQQLNILAENIQVKDEELRNRDGSHAYKVSELEKRIELLELEKTELETLNEKRINEFKSALNEDEETIRYDQEIKAELRSQIKRLELKLDDEKKHLKDEVKTRKELSESCDRYKRLVESLEQKVGLVQRSESLQRDNVIELEAAISNLREDIVHEQRIRQSHENEILSLKLELSDVCNTSRSFEDESQTTIESLHNMIKAYINKSKSLENDLISAQASKQKLEEVLQTREQRIQEMITEERSMYNNRISQLESQLQASVMNGEDYSALSQRYENVQKEFSQLQTDFETQSLLKDKFMKQYEKEENDNKDLKERVKNLEDLVKVSKSSSKVCDSSLDDSRDSLDDEIGSMVSKLPDTESDDEAGPALTADDLFSNASLHDNTQPDFKCSMSSINTYASQSSIASSAFNPSQSMPRLLFSCDDEPPFHDLEWGRLNELQRRNTLCPPHMKSSYPVETQVIDPDEMSQELMKKSTSDSVLKSSSKYSGTSRSSRRSSPTAISDHLIKTGQPCVSNSQSLRIPSSNSCISHQWNPSKSFDDSRAKKKVGEISPPKKGEFKVPKSTRRTPMHKGKFMKTTPRTTVNASGNSKYKGGLDAQWDRENMQPPIQINSEMKPPRKSCAFEIVMDDVSTKKTSRGLGLGLGKKRVPGTDSKVVRKALHTRNGLPFGNH
ncbi:uncharacterized protein LOC141906497 isoform X2 [Tubulanus polymorphus]|uniref:uncharacterized protein LOC141906497 isoform X2 n=1 Tax=Tubulanus polymorphus TaxID=672921 RepID=UPI003DA2FDCD